MAARTIYFWIWRRLALSFHPSWHWNDFFFCQAKFDSSRCVNEFFSCLPFEKFRMSTETTCRSMSRNCVDFPTGVPFTSSMLTEVIGCDKGQFKWMINERNSHMRVLHFKQPDGFWDPISWLRTSKKYDREMKKIFK